jgi:hypothetical protein
MKSKNKLFYTKIEVDGRCIDLLLTEKEITKGSNRIIDPVNSDFIPNTINTCWPIEQPPKCSFWDKILGNCSCKEKL